MAAAGKLGPKFAAVLVASLLFADPAGAGEEVPTLAPVTVIGTFSNPATGRSTMDRQMIERLPAGTGSINELLTLFPDVQAGEGFRAGRNAGEILPPPVSISGGRIFQNNFLIDGLSNNSLLDPAGLKPTVNHDAPGHPQEVFLHPRLVSRISVYDSNIPARFGGFTGGVVEIETRDPAPEFGGALDYRTSHSAWTRFHLAPGESAPEFETHDGGIELNLPLRPGMGVLGSYRRISSRLPKRHLGGTETETRRKDDLFLKYAWDTATGPLRLALSAIPYEEERFIPDVANSDFTVEGGGIRLQGDFVRPIPRGELQLAAAYRRSENSRDAPTHLRQWATTASRPWGALAGSPISYEGGFGDIRKTQEAVGLRAAVTAEEFRTGGVAHLVEWGVEFETVRGTFDRRDSTHVYLGAKVTPDVICGEDVFTCIDEEQFFTVRRIYRSDSVSARINLTDLYLEDRLETGRLTLRPGLRLSYDDWMDNFNAAPRVAAAYDLLGDRRTVLIGGWNRYFGRSLLTYKLREAQIPFAIQTRGTRSGGFLGEWQDSFSGENATRFTRLDTPYADEWTAGIDQALLGGQLAIKYVHREGKDEFARDYGDRQPDGLRYYTLTNGGRSRHESWRFTWERIWPGQSLSLNATWQKSTGKEEDYDAIASGEEFEDRVWFEGKLINTSDLPRRDYNRTWILNLIYVRQLPWGFAFSNTTRYRSGYRALVLSREIREVPGGEGRTDPATGEPVFEALQVYDVDDRPGGVVFDWKLAWQPPALPGLLMSLEIDNVFNKRLETGTARRDFEVGRRFWAGAEYRF